MDEVGKNLMWRQLIAKENATFKRQLAGGGTAFVPNLRGAAGLTQKIGHEKAPSAGSVSLMHTALASQRLSSATLPATSAGDYGWGLEGGGGSHDSTTASLGEAVSAHDAADPLRASATHKHCDVVQYAMHFAKIHGKTPMQRASTPGA